MYVLLTNLSASIRDITTSRRHKTEASKKRAMVNAFKSLCKTYQDRAENPRAYYEIRALGAVLCFEMVDDPTFTADEVAIMAFDTIKMYRKHDIERSEV